MEGLDRTGAVPYGSIHSPFALWTRGAPDPRGVIPERQGPVTR